MYYFLTPDTKLESIDRNDYITRNQLKSSLSLLGRMLNGFKVLDFRLFPDDRCLNLKLAKHGKASIIRCEIPNKYFTNADMLAETIAGRLPA